MAGNRSPCAHGLSCAFEGEGRTEIKRVDAPALPLFPSVLEQKETKATKVEYKSSTTDDPRSL